MLGEAYPVVSAQGAKILERLIKSPAGATMLAEEGITPTRGGAQTALTRFLMSDLVAISDIIPAKQRDHGHRFRAGPPQQLFEITKQGKAALAAHRAAIAAYEAALPKRKKNGKP